MNEFLSCTRKGKTIEEYHEEFVKLSRHAPLMSEEQKLSRFILGLEGKLANEVESLRPTSLADALVRAKSKLNSFTRVNFGEVRKRKLTNYPPPAYKPAKAPFAATAEQAKGPVFRPSIPVKNIQARALPVTQSGKSIQCFGCKEWGHKAASCPKKQTPLRSPLIPQRKAFLGRNQGGRNQQGNNKPMKTSTVNHVTSTEEVDEQAHIYAALDPRGYNQQFSILEVPGDYEGKPLSFLIDSGSSHSFLSPSTIKRLHLTPNPTVHKLRVSLANGSNITTEEQTVDISFQIDKNPTTQRFRILKLGKFQGILGMDWLSQNDSDINCKKGLISFITSEGKRVQVQFE
ncbi:hypothetical protein L7F22_051127 [Adiantum nelumboides]|nr:hypothetical protein [Adiantum nelumboides]